MLVGLMNFSFILIHISLLAQTVGLIENRPAYKLETLLLKELYPNLRVNAACSGGRGRVGDQLIKENVSIVCVDSVVQYLLFCLILK
jgi:hypothetical protein